MPAKWLLKDLAALKSVQWEPAVKLPVQLENVRY